MHKRIGAHGEPFTTLVRTYPHGTIPDNSPPLQPVPLRNTITSQVILTDKGAALNNARMTPNPAEPVTNPLAGIMFVVNNNFSTGRAAIVLGNYVLVSNIDFAVGAVAADTAANIVAAVRRIPGFISELVGPVLAVGYDSGSADVVEFRVVHYGTLVNFVIWLPPGMPDGSLGFGVPYVGPPLIT